MTISTTRKIAMSFVLMAVLCALYSAPAAASDARPIRWDIKDGEYADKAQAERIYEAAQAWLGEHLALPRVPRPQLTIHVGEACPDAALKGACLSPASSELYLRTWDETSPSAVAHAALLAALTQLIDRDEMRRTVATLINEDARSFVSADRR
jgi:hypothetical protein